MSGKTDIDIDWNSPIVNQIMEIKEYNKFIHNPRFVKESVRMFKNPWIEVFSRTPWYMVPIIWTPTSLFLFASGARCVPNVLLSTFAFSFGVFVWTLLEYVLHRFLFHIDLEKLRNLVGGHTTQLGKLLTITHFCMHGVHHSMPCDPLRLVFPPVLSGMILGFIYGGLRIISLFPVKWIDIVVSGILFGYTLYDTMHYMLHYHRDIKIGYFLTMKRYHMHHHFRDSGRGFGITSKLWDSCFAT